MIRKNQPKNVNNSQQETATHTPEKQECSNAETNFAESNNSQVSNGKYIPKGEAHITPIHIYKETSNIPIIVHDALYDTGASISICTLELLKKLKLDNLIKSTKEAPVYGADKKPMAGCVGSLTLNIAIEDTLKRYTDTFYQKIIVFEQLNHDMVIGRDAMKSGIRWTATWPALDIILINPTMNLIKQINAQKRDQVRIANNVKRQDEIRSENQYKIHFPHTFPLHWRLQLIMASFLVEAEITGRIFS